jgi:hypothetical protein
VEARNLGDGEKEPWLDCVYVVASDGAEKFEGCSRSFSASREVLMTQRAVQIPDTSTDTVADNNARVDSVGAMCYFGISQCRRLVLAV